MLIYTNHIRKFTFSKKTAGFLKSYKFLPKKNFCTHFFLDRLLTSTKFFIINENYERIFNTKKDLAKNMFKKLRNVEE